jgi:hypothetical protein
MRALRATMLSFGRLDATFLSLDARNAVFKRFVDLPRRVLNFNGYKA